MPNVTDMPTTGEAIKALMQSAGLSQTALGQKIGRVQQQVSEWIKGAPVPLEVIPQIEEACGVSRGTLLRMAGYVSGSAPSVEDAIMADPDLDPEDKPTLAKSIQAMRQQYAATKRRARR